MVLDGEITHGASVVTILKVAMMKGIPYENLLNRKS
jgi:hypothetical protein